MKPENATKELLTAGRSIKTVASGTEMYALGKTLSPFLKFSNPKLPEV